MENAIYEFARTGLCSVILIVSVIILRVILKKIPQIPNSVFCLMWGLVGLRLLIPFRLKSRYGLIPASPHNTVTADTVIGNPAGMTAVSSPAAAGSAGLSASQIIAAIWLAGAAAMLMYCIISSIRLKKKLTTAIPCGKAYRSVPVKYSENAPTPFIFGIINPGIYVPFNIGGETLKYVVAHESAHLSRFDNIRKPLAFFILSLHWYNPMVWVAYVLFCRDMELACDEKVFRAISEDERYSYAEALVKCSTPKKIMAVCPVAFGESGIKLRVKRALGYKKPILVVTVFAAVLSVIVCVCCAAERTGTEIVRKPIPDRIGKESTDTVISADRNTVEDIYTDFSETVNTKTESSKSMQDTEQVPDSTASLPEKATAPEKDVSSTGADSGTVSPANSVPERSSASDKTAKAAVPVKSSAAAETAKAEEKTAPAETAGSETEAEPEAEPGNEPAAETEKAGHNCSVDGHVYTEGVAIPWSCTDNGVKFYVCTCCGEYKEQLVRASGHDYRSAHVAPTCTENGAYDYTCLTCGDVVRVTSAIEPALGHSFSNGVCTRCGAEE